ncbi:MAG: nucleotidyltransferase family protein [Planctomycetota bacterium]|nr:MAG: nucleotidyltransferase family protein [Planctomycetota bacterium]
MRSFAIIPAAGRSRRMGQPKLLMPWGESTVIDRVLEAWQASAVEAVVAVVHPDDRELMGRCLAGGAVVVQPSEPPAEMKDSILWGLKRLEDYGLEDGDAWLAAPADMPALSSSLIDRVIEAYANDRRDKPHIWAPRHGEKRGHPVLFPWSLAAEVAQLGPDEGLNVLVDRYESRPVDVEDRAIVEDFDTPQEYDRLRSQLEP